MTETIAKETVRTYIEQVWNGGSVDSFDNLASDDFKYYLGSQPGRDKESMKDFLQMVHTAFPDWFVEIESIVGGDSIVFVRWKATATHKGVFHGIPSTGRHVSVTGINMYKLSRGLITEEWEQMDSLGLLQQLGALPPPR